MRHVTSFLNYYYALLHVSNKRINIENFKFWIKDQTTMTNTNTSLFTITTNVTLLTPLESVLAILNFSPL